MLGDIFGFVGRVVGTVCGVAIAPIAIALNVSTELVAEAVKAGCRTQKEVQEWIEENT